MNIIYKIHSLFVSKVYANSLGEEFRNRLNALQKQNLDKEGFVGAIADVAVPAAIFSLVVLVVYAGYMLISSQGNPDKLKEGREVLTNAIIGFFVVVLSVVILLLLSDSLNLNIYS